MLKTLEVNRNEGGWLLLPFDGRNHRFFVKDIQGLEPVKATMVSSSLGIIDGEQFQSSRRDKRNIIIKIGYDTQYGTMLKLRQELYRALMPKKSATFRFHFEDPALGYVDIVGRIESLIQPLFSQDPEATLSVLCYDPDFYVPNATVLNGETNAQSGADTAYMYAGSVPTGVVLRLRPDRQIAGFQWYTTPAGSSSRTMNYGTEPLNAGDVLEISTIPGDKKVSLLRNGVWSSVLRNLTMSSQWALFEPGTNYVRVHVEGTPIPYTIDYRVRHGGL